MRVAIVGAGQDVEYHVKSCRAFAGAELVGIADPSAAKAEECAARYGIRHTYRSTSTLLAEGRPDVVHVVAPPIARRDAVSALLDAGCHVLVETPLALSLEEAEGLFAIAARRGVMLCPVHSQLFEPPTLRAADVLASGTLGPVVQVEGHCRVNACEPALTEYPEPNVLPWAYGLPGGVHQAFLSQPLSVLLPWIGQIRSVVVKQRSTGVLPQRLPDEIDVLLDGERANGRLTLSVGAMSQTRSFRVHCANGIVDVDLDAMTAVVRRAAHPARDGWKRVSRAMASVRAFGSGRSRPAHGTMSLAHAFYRAIESNGPLPVSRERALDVVRAMDDVCARIASRSLRHEPLTPDASLPGNGPRVLVTGGTGLVGTALVWMLGTRGYRVRVLARKLARVERLVGLGAEIHWGDVADIESFDRAFDGCDLVVHLAAGTSGSPRDAETATLQGTRNLLELCRRHRPKRVVYISSCSVYGVADYTAGRQVVEDAPLERFPERRGPYSAAKQRAEAYVTSYMATGGSQMVVLRPGTVIGPSGKAFTPMMGLSRGSTYMVIGAGGLELPLVYVDNLADAIVLCLQKEEAAGQIFNVVDPERIDKRRYVDRVIRRIEPGARVFYLPYAALYAVTWLQEVACGLVGRRPVLTRYRLATSQRRVTYDSGKIVSLLGWMPPVPLEEALERLVAADSPYGDAAAPGEPLPVDVTRRDDAAPLRAESRSAH